MRAFLSRVVVLGLAVFAACSAPRAYYEVEWVNFEPLGLATDGTLSARYSTASESMWFSPGVDLRREGSAVRLFVVREYYKNPGDPELRGEMQKDAGYSMAIRLEDMRGKQLLLCDGKNEKLVWQDARVD